MTTYSTSLKLELIGDGQQSGTWGQTTNKNLGTLLEQAITGVVTIVMVDANYTLSSLNGVSDEARNAIIVATGTNSAQRDIIAPLVEKIYTVKNSTTGGYAVRIIGASGSGVAIPNGYSMSVYCDGTNFYQLDAGGTVAGPVSSTANAVARFDGTTGSVLKDSSVTITDNGDLSINAVGARITGDFSSSDLDLTDRVLIQTNVVDGDTKLGLIPNGTGGNGTVFQLRTYDPDAVGTNGNLSIWGCSEDVGYTFLKTGQEGTGTPHDFVFGVNGIEFMRANIIGEVQIQGTTDRGSYNLQVNGTGVWGAGAYVNGSDARLKDNVKDIDSCLSVVNSLRPVTFTYKEDYSKDQSVQPGFIAQELQEALSGKDYIDGVVQAGGRHLNVAYQTLIPVLTKAIQEQQEQINQLRAELTALNGA